MIYSSWITTIADLLDIAQTITDPTSATPSTDPNFNNIIAPCIDYTENRLQRDLDLLATRVTDATATLTANSRLLPFPTDVGIYLVIEEVIPIVSGIAGMPMIPVSREFLDTSWPAETAPTTPSVPYYWAMYDNANALVAPPPDTGYGVKIVGTQRIAKLSSTNTSNFLTLSLPDVYVLASMVFLTAYQRDWGGQSSDPQMSQSWETQYKTALQSAGVEEARKKYQSVGWNSRFPTLAVAEGATGGR